MKSSFCGESGACVDVEVFDEYVVLTDAEDSQVRYTADEWYAFVQGVKAGEFD